MKPADPSENHEYGAERELAAPQSSTESGEAATESDRPSDDHESSLAQAPDEKTRGEKSETLAVLALLVPLLAQGTLLACRFDSIPVELALSWGAIIVTALLLAVDAARLGTIDRNETHRSGPVLIFLGLILLWIVCYPCVYFRRRHFGRTNFGPLAILVAVFYAAAPFVQQFVDFGVVGMEPPTCDSREVVAMLDDQIRQAPLLPRVESVSGHRELSYDRAGQIRKGQCRVRVKAETLTATYTVKVVDRQKGVFTVQVDPFYTTEPPVCTDPAVISHLEFIVRGSPNGTLVETVTSHEELRYNPDTKTRHGRCRVTMARWSGDVGYKVYWVDQKTGYFQVEIED